MSHFSASIRGTKGEVTRCGAKTSGIITRVLGWNVGITVEGYYDEELDRDVFRIWRNGGSNGLSRAEVVAVVTEQTATKRTERCLNRENER